MNRNEHVPPKWTAVRIDESQHCGEEFLERCGGKVYAVYLVDMNSVTYCCEITPSYCMIPIDLVAGEYPDDEASREKLYEELQQAMWETDMVSYMHCRSVDRLPAESKWSIELQLDEEEWREDPLRCEDNAREVYTGCPAF